MINAYIDPAHIALLLAFVIVAAVGEPVSRRRVQVMTLQEAAKEGLLR